MSERAPQETPAGHWVSYRPEIKVLDCTIRDGGLMNDHKFSDETVQAVYQACVEGGIDYMEIGYINSRTQFPPGQFGPWKHSVESDIRRIVGDNDAPLKLSAMADAEKSDYKTDILPKSESVLDLIRVATYIHQIPLALDMIKDAHDKGYETSLNLMALSTVPESELNEALAMVAQSEADVICIVDSFGALYGEQIDGYVDTFRSYAAAGARKWACTPTTTASWHSPIRSRPRSGAPTGSTPAWPGWAAEPATARWSCCSVSCTTRSSACGRCCTASSTISSRCARR